MNARRSRRRGRCRCPSASSRTSDALYADDYTALDSSGRIRTKRDLLDALPTDPEMVEGRYELVSVRRWGTIAVASGRGRMLYREPDGSTRLSEYDSVNVFELRGDEWVYAAAFLPQRGVRSPPPFGIRADHHIDEFT